MKSYFVDTAATVIFFTVVAALGELLIAGMGPTQVLIARLIMHTGYAGYGAAVWPMAGLVFFKDSAPTVAHEPRW